MVADGLVGMGLAGLSAITKPPMFQEAMAQVTLLFLNDTACVCWSLGAAACWDDTGPHGA
jgi:hypothetical protein